MSILSLVPSLRSGQPWSQILQDVIRPEFAADIYVASPANPVLWPATCAVQTCHAPVRHHHMCAQHVTRWHKAGRPPQGTWMATPEALIVNRPREVKACAVQGCPRSAHGPVCRRHEAIRRTHFDKDLPGMLRDLVGDDEFGDQAPVACYVPWCHFPVAPRITAGTDAATQLCDGHYGRYASRVGHLRRTGREPITIEEFVLTSRDNPAPKFKTVGLPGDLALEVKYVLQARSDERGPKWRTDQHNVFVGNLRATGLVTLTGPEDELVAAFREVGANSLSVGFARAARSVLLTLSEFGTDPYARDTWDLVALVYDEIARDDVRRLDFTGIRPDWLRDLAKRWIKHRLNTSRISTVSSNLRALTKMCQILDEQNSLPTQPEQFTRATVEAYLLAVRRARYSRYYEARLTSTPRMFLDHVARTQWEPRLSLSTRIYHDEVPTPGKSLPRYISDFVMTQIENPATLARIRTFEAETMLRILIECGLRGPSARRLSIDALTRDQHGAPYLRYTNTKFDREAVIPISDSLASRVQEQAQRSLARFPRTPWLLPRPNQIDGLLPYSKGAWKQQFGDWLHTIRLVDETGRPVRVTPHQFRHTVATRMVNRGVPLHVISTFLDHSSVAMTEVYARLHPDTVLRETKQYLDDIGNKFEPFPLTANAPLPQAVLDESRHVIEDLFTLDGEDGGPHEER